jgi:hypothetical protein
MRTSGRRRFDVVLLGLGAVATAGVTVIGGLAGDPERVTGMWVGAELDDTGSAAITEIIDYDFGLAQDKHGIFRDIPGLTTESPVTVASASAPDAIADRTSELIGPLNEPGVRLKIGDASTTITGRHRYRLGYELRNLAPGGSLAWDAVGTGWEVEVAQSEIHVVAPWRFRDLQCSQGGTGTSGGCELTQPEPGHLVVTVGSVASGEGVTIGAQRGTALDAAPELPAPPVSAPPDPGAGLAKPGAAAAVSAAGAAAVASTLVKRRGRERVSGGGAADAAWAGGGGPTSEVLVDQEELASMATTEFAPPEGLSPSLGGVLHAEAVRPEHKVAWLIEAAIQGAVELEEEGGRTVRLVRTGTSGDPLTQTFVAQAFAGRSTIELGGYDSQFAGAWSSVGSQLATWQATSGLWDPAGDRRRVAVRILGVLAAIVGFAVAGVGGALASRWGTQWLPAVIVGALLAGAGIAGAVRGWELRVRTPQGSGLWLRVESFRRFLAGSEAFHAEEAAKRGVLREYTAWAVALGEIDRWRHAVEASTAIPDQAGLGYVYMAPLLMSSTTSASTAPSSSGSGGGGGGSVGGGGGGGGGGSW